MKYYKIFYNDMECYEKKLITSQDIVNYDDVYYCSVETCLCAGNVAEKWDDNTTIVCKNSEQTTVPDMLLSPDLWLVISKRTVDVLAPFVNDEIQYLPVKIDAVQPQMKNKQYFVANIIKTVQALDLKKCLFVDLGEDRPEDMIIHRYALKEDAIGNHHIFKVNKKPLCFSNFVSEDVKNAIESAGLIGFDFEEVKLT